LGLTTRFGSPGNAEEEHHGAIELLAYSFWQERGCPFGTPETDWFRAEDTLREHDPDDGPGPLVSAAKTIGGKLGEIAAVFTGPAPAT
jgi:hypothetical protein